VYKKFFFGYVLLIILLVLLPINVKESRINHTYLLGIRLDYILHVGLFIPWMFFYVLIKPLFTYNYLNRMTWLLAGLLFSIFAELLQYFTPYRALNWHDLVANCIGVVLSFIIFLFLGPKQTQSENTHI
jgi:VanZ family protein